MNNHSEESFESVRLRADQGDAETQVQLGVAYAEGEAGKITALGGRINLPPGTEEIDIQGKHVYPGLIAAHSVIGLVEIEQVRATRDTVEVGDIKPNVRAEAAFNPDSEILPVTRANGITLALSVPSGGAISGTSALMMLDGWTWEAMTLKAPVGLHVRWR
jgi:imidazolonepropionase-like amidohydrolase